MRKPQIDDQLLNFKIQDLLGEGGMAVVYIAEDVRLRRKVVIKFPKLPDDPVAHEECRKRFQREGMAQARVNHPNVCTIYDVGVHEVWGPYIVMEFIEGESISQRLRNRGPMSSREAVKVAIAVAKGLVAAHAADVTHRDLTHNNVMRAPSGFIKVLDFGLALLKDDPHRATDPPRPGIGTPDFMAPEQLRRGNVTHRCDIFALGVLLYCMITGRPPVVGTSAAAPIRSIPGCQDVPQSLETVVTRALQIDEASRYQTAGEMLEALEEVQKVLDGIARPYSYFDCSALLDVVCDPAASDPFGTRAANARLVFRIEYEQECAVASSVVLLQLIETIAGLYFEGVDRSLQDDDRVHRFVRSKRSRIAREMGMSEPELRWSHLKPAERWSFTEGVAPFFLKELRDMAAQLTAVPIEPAKLFEKLEDLSDNHELSIQQKWGISDAYSLHSVSFYTEERAYQGPEQTHALETAGIQLRLITGEGVQGMPPPFGPDPGTTAPINSSQKGGGSA